MVAGVVRWSAGVSPRHSTPTLEDTVGRYTHLCPLCADRCDYICIRCRGCETCCKCETPPNRFLSRQSREAQHVIAHAAQQDRRRGEQLRPEELRKEGAPDE